MAQKQNRKKASYGSYRQWKIRKDREPAPPTQTMMSSKHLDIAQEERQQITENFKAASEAFLFSRPKFDIRPV